MPFELYFVTASTAIWIAPLVPTKICTLGFLKIRASENATRTSLKPSAMATYSASLLESLKTLRVLEMHRPVVPATTVSHRQGKEDKAMLQDQYEYCTTHICLRASVLDIANSKRGRIVSSTQTKQDHRPSGTHSHAQALSFHCKDCHLHFGCSRQSVGRIPEPSRSCLSRCSAGLAECCRQLNER